MNQEMLCTWLGLSARDWPPDPYTLLGLKSGEADLPRIEQQVQERMAKLRCYQLSHPEEATEGMNRLALAFINLTEAATKASQRPAPAPAPATRTSPPVRRKVSKDTMQIRPKTAGDTAVIDQTKMDWRLTPPPVRSPAAGDSNPEAAAPSAPAPVRSEADELAALIHDLAWHSSEARTGLGTLPALIERIDQTRQLLTAWQRLGCHLRRQREKTDLKRWLATIRDVSEVYPPFVGHPGKPGYRIVALARLSMTAEMFQSMAATQSDDLLRDWETGHKILLDHRRYLRKHLKSMRHHGNMGLFMRAVRSLLNDHPVLCGTATVFLIALCIALRFLLF
jgi:hypothetical protein